MRKLEDPPINIKKIRRSSLIYKSQKVNQDLLISHEKIRRSSHIHRKKLEDPPIYVEKIRRSYLISPFLCLYINFCNLMNRKNIVFDQFVKPEMEIEGIFLLKNIDQLNYRIKTDLAFITTYFAIFVYIHIVILLYCCLLVEVVSACCGAVLLNPYQQGHELSSFSYKY